jgi:hypothetical protein
LSQKQKIFFWKNHCRGALLFVSAGNGNRKNRPKILSGNSKSLFICHRSYLSGYAQSYAWNINFNNPDKKDWTPNRFGPQSNNLGAVIRGFISTTKRFANEKSIEFE